MVGYAADPPPRELAPVGGGAPGEDRVQGRGRLLLQPGAQPEPARRRRGRRAQRQQRRVPRGARRVPAVGAHHIHQRAAHGPPRLLLGPPQPGRVGRRLIKLPLTIHHSEMTNIWA
uniref:GUN6 n=1 Tax=Arundo donax TaxID=35708 RepID=A0A0A9EHS1_ARUDO